MSFSLEMRPCRLGHWSGQMDIADALAFAREKIDPAKGWLLAECPERLVWQKASQALEPDALKNCRNLYIFDDRAELRLQKAGAFFYARRLWLAEAGGVGAEIEAGQERLSSYQLRGGGRLKYAEFFTPDAESGILQLRYGRFCGCAEGRP